MKTGKKRIYNNIFFTYMKKHNCPNCGNLLERIKCAKTINSSSEEANNFDFSFGESFLIGDIEFTWDEFKCNNCNNQFTISQLKKYKNKV